MAKNEGFDLGAMLAGLDIGPNSGTTREQLEYIDLDLIDDDSENFYETKGIEDLAANISLFGLMDPLRIREDPEKPGRYKVTSGHRRRLALKLLKEEDPEKYADVPCIRDQVMQSNALQELKLIFANKDNRKYSPADLSEEAVRVEKLLYQLKEEGYEFPGRMRDHVAQAVNASKSKLSRLKVIREKLDKVWVLSFKVDKLNESAAYALAKLPAEWQRVIYHGTRDKGSGVVSGVCSISEITVDNYRECFEKIKKIECSVDSGLCAHRSVMMDRSVRTAYIWNACKGCCLDCDDLAKCGYSCYRVDDKKRTIKQQRKAEIAEEKAASKAQAEADEILIAATYDRAREAREKANISAKELLTAAGMNPVMDRFYTDHETGKAIITKNTGLAYLNEVSVRAARQLLAVADTLGVSTDYLLGRDGPNLGPSPYPTEEAWGVSQFENPVDPGSYVVLARWSEKGSMKPHIFAWDGNKWLYAELDAAAAGAIVCYWMPMPEE